MTKKSGRIVKGIGGFYYVSVEGIWYECRARGVFRKDRIKPLVGDLVTISVTDEEKRIGSVEEVLPRKNTLIRPESANVDRALVVFACTSPEPNYVLLDRFLIMLREQGVSCLLVWNKKDLVSGEETERLLEIYRDAQVSVRCISAKSQADVEGLQEELHGRTTILAGPSGVGKSTLLNALCPRAAMETGEISTKLKRGKHTTRHAEIFEIDESTCLMDTPGFTALTLGETEAEEVGDYYPEFAPFTGECRFQPCSHTHEPECAVRAAAEDGKIPMRRYLSYQVIYSEQKERRKY